MKFFDIATVVGDCIIAMTLFVAKFIGSLALIILACVVFVVLFLALIGLAGWVEEQLEARWREKNRIKKRLCDNCRYKACSYKFYPCRDGLEQKLITGKCGLWEPQLRIQKLWRMMKGRKYENTCN